MATNDPHTGWTGQEDADGGAFSVEGDVSWSNGFGDEDLAGNAPKKVAPAPRPGTPTASVAQPVAQPARQPVAPARQPVAQPTRQAVGPARQPVGQPAQRPAMPPAQPLAFQKPTLPTAPAAAPPASMPAAPPATVPATPPHVQPPAVSAPPVQAPQAPVQVPQAPVQAPQAEAVVVPDVSAYTAPVVPSAPAAVAPTAPVAASPVVDDTPFVDDYAPPANVAVYTPEPPAPVTPAAQPEPPKGKKGKKGKAAKDATPKGPGLRDMRGGRWVIKAFRITAFTTMILLMAAGLRATIVGSQTPDLATITETVASEVNGGGFPVAEGQAFALAFTKAYLTYDETTQEERAVELAAYSSEASSGVWGWNGRGKQTVISGPIVGGYREIIDANRAVFNVAAQVDSGRWLYLAVPVYTENGSSFVVSSAPAFVAPPAVAAEKPPTVQKPSPDDTLSGTLQAQLFDGASGYFAAWAASDVTALNRLTTPNSTFAAKNGLQGSVTFEKVLRVYVPAEEGEYRTAEVSVQWATEAAGSYIQNYTVTVFQNTEGTWIVDNIVGGTL